MADENVTDAPPRIIIYTDSKLSEMVWAKVEEVYGLHTHDFMASDANAMKTANGQILRHLTPCPMPFFFSQGLIFLLRT